MDWMFYLLHLSNGVFILYGLKLNWTGCAFLITKGDDNGPSPVVDSRQAASVQEKERRIQLKVQASRRKSAIFRGFGMVVLGLFFVLLSIVNLALLYDRRGLLVLGAA